MTKYVAVIIPTTGAETLKTVLESLYRQTYENVVPKVVVDGRQHLDSVMKCIYSIDSSVKYQNFIIDNMCILPENTGSNGFYGQRIMVAFAYLTNQDYVLFLDQDNWFEPNHIETMVSKLETSNCSWVYSLRNIYSKSGEYLLKDDCESLGKWNPVFDYKFVDNNCYCLKRETVVAIAPFMYGGWGQDRVLYNGLEQHFPNFCCTGKYTVNYRLDGNSGSVKQEFFEYGNNIVANKFFGNYPWRL